MTVRMQSGCRRQNDEVHHQVREEYAGEDVVPGTSQVPRGRVFALFDGGSARGDIVLDFLGGLPEEEVGRDRSSQDADQGCPIRACPLQSWNQRRPRNSGPVRVREEGSDDVGEQNQREPFEDPGNVKITCPEQQAYTEQRVRGCPIQ